MFKWFGIKIRNLLGITELQEQLENTKKELKSSNDLLGKLRSENDTIINENEELRKKINKSTSQYNALMELVDVGAEVSVAAEKRGGPSSWAVICLAGRVHHLKFYVLGDDHMGHIFKFLEPFDKANRVIDAPDHIRRFML